MRPNRLIAAAAGLLASAVAVTAQRPDAFQQSREHPAIAYTKTPASDPVARLSERVAQGAVTLQYNPTSGYLESVLKALNVPVESQMLVTSQTSLQGDDISFLNPRALFFNDEVAVGWVRGSELLELAAQDPRQGTIFYTLEQKSAASPQVVRQNADCLTCHLTWDTLAVPGMTATSVYPIPDKNSYANGFTTDHRSPLSERWGGWFVTGQTGNARHMGNVPTNPDDKGKSKIANPLAMLRSVEGVFDLTGYPTPYSDVVALLVFNHQAHMMNLITRAGWEARVAGASPDGAARVRSAAADLVDYLLFGDEAPLRGKVDGTSGFAAVFASHGPRDSKGRSLRDFDLQRRLFRYPCSYLIYSPAFDALPAAAKDAVYARLYAVLTGKASSDALKRLTADDRRAVLEILRDTKKDLPPYFAS